MQPTRKSSAALAAVLLMLLIGCTSREVRFPDLEAGARKPEPAADAYTLFLLFDPEECLTCGAQMGRWLTLRRHRPDQVYIVFSRAPAEAERRVLAKARVPVDGIVQNRTLRKSGRGGHAFLFRGRDLVHQARIADDKSMALIEQELRG